MTDKLLPDDRDTADHRVGGQLHFPGDLRDILRHAPENFAVEVFHDLRAALLPPHIGGSDLLAVFQRQNFGEIRVGIGLRGIVVGHVRRSGSGAAAGARPEGLNAELVHHILMVFGGRPVEWRQRGVGGKQSQGDAGQRNEPGDVTGKSHIRSLSLSFEFKCMMPLEMQTSWFS